MTRWPQQLSGLALGGDYNPEQWPEEVWAQDVRLMQEAGVTFATVGVFSWALLEPTPGRYDLGWLDRVLDLLSGGGVSVVLATATASAPPWLTTRHPEVLPVTADGVRLSHGSRQSWCPSSPVYREHSLRLVEQLATRYGDHPALVLWHVNNEIGCHNARCYCDVSAAAFRRWLRARYDDDLDRLNAAWGTQFWSQTYRRWEEVLPPRATTAQHNPTHLLDFERFSSAELLAQHVTERDVLRRITPDVPVTTNFMTMAALRGMDYWSWAPEQDVVSTDHYLNGAMADPHAELAFSGDLTRGLAGGRPWWLMEHSTSAVNWQPVNVAKAPGQLLRDALAHVARGADAVGYFQWRASRAGAEKFHSSLVPHAGTDTRLWREVCELGEVLHRLAEVAGSTVHSDVALVFDWEAMWACDQGSHPSSGLRYVDQVLAMHASLRRAGTSVDMVRAEQDLSGYRLVLVPNLYLCTDRAAARVSEAVHAGAHAVVTYFSGITDEHDHIRLGGYPGAFRDLLGIRVEEFSPLPAGEQVRLDDGSTGDLWTEDLSLRGAQAVARYLDGPLPGVPAVTRATAGTGSAWYLATRLDQPSLDALLARVCQEAGVEPVACAPAGVEVVRRRGESASYLFVLNGTADDAEVTGAGGSPLQGTNLVSGSQLRDGRVVVPAGGVAVVREPL